MAGERQEILERGSYFPGDWVRPRFNPGTWMAMVDVTEIFTGHRSTTRTGSYELFEGPIGVQLRVEEAEKSEPFLIAEKEWELDVYFSPSHVWREDGRLHMLYEAGENTCYAVSDDGYNWERPVLGQMEFNGSTDNNILKTSPGGTVFEDPSAPPAERYKAVGAEMFWLDRESGEVVDDFEADRCWRAEHYENEAYTGRKVVLKGALVGSTSPDRFEWTRVAEPLANYSVNGGICPGYDEHNKTYFAFIQPQGAAPVEPQSLGPNIPETEVVRRAVGLTRTKDFRHWPAAKLLLHPDAQDPLDISFYGACYFAYPGRPELHAMILPVFHQVTDHMDLQIAFSRDGLVWTRPERRPVLGVGRRGSGAEGGLHPWRNGLVELPDDYWAVPYQSTSALHTVLGEHEPVFFPELQPNQNRWARWRHHRLCGAEAENEGRFTIPTVFRRENELRLNYRCAPGGWIKVELLRYIPTQLCVDASNPVNGYSFAECDLLVGDEENQVVTWQGNSDISKVGEMAAIRVKMFQAKLFAYRL